MQPNDSDRPGDGDQLSPAEEAFRDSVLNLMARIEEKIDQILKDQASEG